MLDSDENAVGTVGDPVDSAAGAAGAGGVGVDAAAAAAGGGVGGSGAPSSILILNALRTPGNGSPAKSFDAVIKHSVLPVHC